MAETEPRSWTYEALLAEGLDPKRWEIEAGELVERPGLSFRSACALSRLTELLGHFVRTNRLGVTAIAGRYELQVTPRTERLPDLSFVRASRLPPELPSGTFEGPADLAVEVLSSSDSVAAAAKKARTYLGYGVSEVWNVDPEAETITVFRPGVPAKAYSQGDALTSDLLPGFSLDLTELFAR